MKSYAIGSKIESCYLIYQVEESDTCKGCAFMYEEEKTCERTKNEEIELGPCDSWHRIDGKNVIFKHVGEVK